MSLQNGVLEGVVVVLVLGWIIYRQTRWQVVDLTRVWRGPIILAVAGVLVSRSAVAGASIGTLAVALLALEAVLSVGVGLGMGMLSQVRQVDGELQARTGLAGSLLWFVMLAVRLGVDVWASSGGAKIVASAGIILLMLALNRAGRTVTLLRRTREQYRVAAP